jgi:nucleotide-binding universal stress UspA family protein
MGMSKVVVGYDPSDGGQRAFEAGIELAGALRAEVHLVTAFSDGPAIGDEPTAERREADQLLEQAAGRIDLPGVEVHRHAVPRAPAAALVDVAAEVGADVIVIGNRGAQSKTRALGSVAGAVVARASCSVFVVKTY